MFVRVILLILILNKSTFALDIEQVKLPNTEVRYLESKQVGIKYRLLIGLPSGYKNDNKKYDILYLLDANYSFALAHNMVEHLSKRNNMTPLIIVGISYVDDNYMLNRTRDYTPVLSHDGGYGVEYTKHSGGAAKFKKFIELELIPFIKKTYRVTNKRTLVGHSYGGLFTSWIALTSPSLFDSYISISPSLWYANKHIFKILNKNTKRSRINMYFAIGALENCGDYKMVEDIKTFSHTIKNYVSSSHLDIFEGDNHASVFPLALSKGLIFTYSLNNLNYKKKFMTCSK
ncbi:MAG: alpha/beta hydrolase [Sphingobacteriia bacterium]|nr:alpha/beta hydrolase [Sphingobacteriia bacterium]